VIRTCSICEREYEDDSGAFFSICDSCRQMMNKGGENGDR